MNDCQISDLQQIQDFHCQDSTLQELKVAKYLKKTSSDLFAIFTKRNEKIAFEILQPLLL